MAYSKIKGPLTSRIGRPVNYSAPKDVRISGGKGAKGKIIDEIWADPSVNEKPPRTSNDPNDWGDYSFCSQLIKWENGDYSIRLAYYRRRTGENHWEYASQMTIDGPCETIKTLLEKTLTRREWFE